MAITLDKSHQEDHLGLAMRLEELDVTSLYIGTVKQPAAADKYVAVADANYTALVLNSGKTHVIANVSADRTITLPSPTAGLNFKFITSIVAADGHDWIFDTGSDTNFYLGGLVFLDTDTDVIATAAGNGTADSKLQVNLPDAGTTINFLGDGTHWLLDGHVNSATAPSWAGQ